MVLPINTSMNYYRVIRECSYPYIWYISSIVMEVSHRVLIMNHELKGRLTPIQCRFNDFIF